MNPISDSNNGHFASLGIHVENNQSSGRTAYSKEFKTNNGGSYTATVYSSKLNATPTEIETLIFKAIEIAKNLGIGEGGLEKINITGGGDNPSIMGTYQSDGQNSSGVVDLLARLKEQAASGSELFQTNRQQIFMLEKALNHQNLKIHLLKNLIGEQHILLHKKTDTRIWDYRCRKDITFFSTRARILFLNILMQPA